VMFEGASKRGGFGAEEDEGEGGKTVFVGCTLARSLKECFLFLLAEVV
jgi:hypothetical protein